ncbi:MAG TPA: hypothetical protein GX523_20340 [Desulfitobacterium dehalogenans]|uniref:Uncharacterized protein n=1 Tax=Desulfitobacterium dehalogenans TaxID=36854 RepID=A0A7C6Z7B0_9FIRM|nr:hypothetical protein [Desulfitobacterium dehalogenans]
MDIKNKVRKLSRYSSMHLDTSNATEERNQDQFHIDLPVQAEVEAQIEAGIPVIILTGEAGEGKTHIIKRLIQKYGQVGGTVAGYRIVEDFSALGAEGKRTIIQSISDVIRNELSTKTPRYLIAANIGILMRTIMKIDKKLIDFLSDTKRQSHVRSFNFESRNLAEDENGFRRLVEAFYQCDMVDCSDSSCKLQGECPFVNNLKELSKPHAIMNIRILCDAIFLMGGHVTLRELLSFLASLATSGYDCESIVSLDKEQREMLHYTNIFDKRDGVILDKIAPLDPANESSPDDYQLYHSLKNIEAFRRAKRSRFFQNASSTYKSLPVPYLQEYKDIIDRINHEPYYFDITTETGSEFGMLKKGFVRLLDPQETNLQISFFAIPKPVGKRIKTQFMIDFNKLTMIWHHPQWKTSLVDCEIKLPISIKEFCLSVLCEGDKSQDDNEEIDLITQKINFDLYRQICLARDQYVLPQLASALNKYGLQQFFMKILMRYPEFSEKVNIIFDSSKALCNFEMSFYRQSRALLRAQQKKVVLIKKI